MGRSVLFTVAGAVLLAFLAVGCSSVGALGEYRFRGAALAAEMRPPPEPRVAAASAVRIDGDNPVASAISVGTSMAKAASARAAEERLRRALRAVDLPEEMRAAALDECAALLGCDAVARTRSADFVLELDIREYGIDAAEGGAVSFRIEIAAVLVEARDGRQIWRARVSVQEPVTPAVFGLGGSAGNVLGAALLAELSEEQIGRGLMVLSREAAGRLADRLERDLWRASR